MVLRANDPSLSAISSYPAPKILRKSFARNLPRFFAADAVIVFTGAPQPTVQWFRRYQPRTALQGCRPRWSKGARRWAKLRRPLPRTRYRLCSPRQGKIALLEPLSRTDMLRGFGPQLINYTCLLERQQRTLKTRRRWECPPSAKRGDVAAHSMTLSARPSNERGRLCQEF